MYEINYCCIEDYPVQINCIEKLEYTLDNYIENTQNNISEVEWKSIIFQICFGLSVAQKQYDFVHNDLHSSNIMFKETELEYLYYNFKGNCFKIPTFGKITKIIDFGRATFNYKNKVFFSDVFKKHGDAEGQYSYPYLNNLKNCKIKPNKSFDLSRLATTIIEHFDEDSNIYRLLKLWCMDKYGNFLMNLEDDFNLYRIIAKNVKSAVPKNQINKLIFKEFIIEKEDIKDEYIYNY
jgi:serine/threonine protein kinase